MAMYDDDDEREKESKFIQAIESWKAATTLNTATKALFRNHLKSIS